MTRLTTTSVTLILLSVGMLFGQVTTETETAATASYMSAPSYFIPNQAHPNTGKRLSQQDGVTAFVQTRFGRVYFTASGAFIGMRAPSPAQKVGNTGTGTPLAVFQSGFDPAFAAKKGLTPRLAGQTDATVNFLVGPRERWQTGLPTYEKVVYDRVWDGVSVEYLGFMDRLAYRVIVAPGADPSVIEMQTGAALTQTENGDLIAEIAGAQLQIGRVKASQLIDGRRVPVSVALRILGDGAYGFAPGNYNPRYALKMEPELTWSTFLGGGGGFGDEIARAAASDVQGDTYIAGETPTADFPTQAGAIDAEWNGTTDVFVTKLNSAGSGLEYSTFLGGEGADIAYGLTLDIFDNLYLTGSASPGFPTTNNGWNRTHEGDLDVFVAKLNPNGTQLLYAGLLGGGDDDVGYAVAVDDNGAAVVTGGTASSDFPTTAGVYDGSHNGFEDGFVARIDALGSNLEYATLIGGTRFDRPVTIALDSSGNTLIAGETASSDYPVSGGAFDEEANGSHDAFVSKLSQNGATLMFSTFLGGSSFDDIAGLVLDGNGDIIVAGSTFSNDFPASNGAFDQTLSGTNDGFVAKLDAAGANLMFATYLGGSSTEDVVGVAVDSEGNAYLAGTTASSNFPASLGGVQENFGGVLDAFIVKVNATGTNLEFATFLGGTGTDEAFGMNLDLDNQVIVVGKTHSADYPTSASGFDRALGGNVDAFVTKIDSTGTTLRFSTFLGGSSGDAAFDVAVDGAGAVYVTGDTQAEDFPTTGGVFDPDFNGSNDVYVAKLDPTGANLTYATYIGGSQEEGGVAVAVDGAGNAYVTGFTRSSDFPTTAGAFSQTLTGTSDVFVTKLNATGTALSYSSFLGGDGFERATDIAVDGAGNAHVVGATFASDFPTTGGAFDTTFASSSDGFVTKFNATGTALLYSTLLGTTGGAEVAGIALDGAGNAALAGTTGAADFPTTAGAYDETANGDDDVFVSLLNVTGTNLIFSTLLGGSGQDTATGIAIGQNDDLYVTGYTRSSSFPITGGAFDTSFSGVYEGFAARIASAGNALTYATYLGGSRSDYPASIAVDSDDRAVITGQTESTNFPTTTNAFDRSANGGTDAFVTLLSDDGTQSLYSSYLGGADEDYGNGVVFDPSGNGVVVGSTRSSEFPTTAGSFKPNPGGVGDGFVTAICFDLPDPAGAITGSTTFCSGQTGVTYSVAAVTGATGYTWTVPFGATITAGQGTTSITVTFGTIAGNVTVAAENACGPSPRAELAVTLSGGVSFTTQPSDVTTCPTEQVQFSVVAEGAGSLTYQWYKDNVLLGGETSADLVLASVTSADAGSYQCEVTDSCSSLRSDAALLTISGLADVSVQPVSQGLGLNPPEFEVNLACAGINTTTLWSADPATTLVTNGGMVTLNPPPSVSTQVTATVRDTDTNAETTASAWLLVSPNTGYDDANGDGCNNIADLWELTPFWQRPFENDPDGNGFIDVRDFLYLNLTDPFPCPL